MKGIPKAPKSSYLSKMERVVRIIPMRAPQSDRAYWMSKTPQERIAALETLRQQYVQLQRIQPRLQRVCRIVEK